MWISKIVVKAKSVINVLNNSTFVFQIGDFIFRSVAVNNGSLKINSCFLKVFDYYNVISTSYCLPRNLKNIKYINYISRTFIYYWRRVILRGRCFRVRNFKDKKLVILNFGHSHPTLLSFNDSWGLFKKRRKNFVWTTWSYKNFCRLLAVLPDIRKYNYYTMRGLRFRKQAIVRRPAKISQRLLILD